MNFSTLLQQLLREEWRIHSELFEGGWKLALLPLQIGILLTVGFALLVSIDLSSSLLETALIALSFLVGLQTGTIGFVTQDTMENMVGGLTSVVFTARTHPISERKSMIAFVVKDFIFYTLMLLVPLSVAFIVGVGAGVATTFLTVLGWYALGAGLTLNVSTVNSRSLSIAGVVVLIATYFLSQDFSVLWNPVYALVLGVLLVLISFVFFRTTPTEQSSSSTASRFSQISPSSLPFSRVQSTLALKSLRDIQRSSGGLAKLPLMGGIIVGLLLSVAEFITRGTPFTLQSYFLVSTILATPAIVVYNWLFQSDSFSKYEIHPFTKTEIYEGKKNAYYLLLVVEVLAVLAVGLYLADTVVLAVLSTLVFVSLSLYLFGILTKLAGFNPGSRLFDSTVYLYLTVLTIVGIGPFLLMGFLFSIQAPTTIGYVIAVGYSLLVGGVGVYLMEATEFDNFSSLTDSE